MAKTSHDSTAQTGPVTRAIAAMRNDEPAPPRRGFLRGLALLPLIGGSVNLIGNPTAAAEPITPGMLATYAAWLHYEHRSLMHASCGEGAGGFVPFCNPGAQFHFPLHFDLSRWGLAAQQRAPVVLSAVGCPLTSAEAEAQWARTFKLCSMTGAR